MSKNVEIALGAFERKILRRIYGPTEENVQWRIRSNNAIVVCVYKDTDVVHNLKTRMGWTRLQDV
jgi:hypothetical protein